VISPLIEKFYQQVDLNKSKLAIKHNSQKITFFELAKQVDATSEWLSSKGIGPGNTVLLYVPMSISLYVLLLAIWHRGAVAIFVDAWTTKNRLDVIAKSYKIDAFIGIPKAHLLRLFSSNIRKIGINIWIFPWWRKTHAGSSICAEPVSPSDTALVTFTTGSTGVPKGANRTHDYLMTQNSVLSNHLNLSKHDIDLITLPIFLLNNLAQGITSVIAPFNSAKPDSIDPNRLTQLMLSDKITSSSGSPIIFQKLADYCLKTNTTLTHFKKLFIGGAPVFPDIARKLIQAFENTTIEIVYGSTEAEPISAISANVLAQKAISVDKGLWVGNPVSSIELVILDTSKPLPHQSTSDEFAKAILPKGKIGEICVTGYHVLKHYYHNPEAEESTKIKVDDRIWHRTGDAGYLDENSDIFLMGNLKNRIEHNQSILYLFPYEILFNEISGIKRATMVKVENHIIIAIEAEHDDKTSHACIESQLKILPLPTPWKIRWINIPRDPRHNSKIDYKKLAELL